MRADSRTLEQILGGFYNVPDFQREFVWGKKDVVRLLGDLYESMRAAPQNPYFLGSIVLYPELPQATRALVDGQQRMTTLFLLFSEIRNRLSAAGRQTVWVDGLLAAARVDPQGNQVTVPRLVLQYEELQEVLAGLSSGALQIADLGAQDVGHKLGQAVKHIRAFIDETVGNVDQLARFGAHVLQQGQVVEVEVDDLASALRVFEILNFTGKKLTSLDLLKLRLFQGADQATRRGLEAIWQQMLRDLQGAGETQPVRFLRYYLVACYHFDAMPSATDVFDWVREQAGPLGLDENPTAFLRSLARGAKDYRRFLTGYDSHNRIEPSLRAISFQKSRVRQHLPVLLSGRHLSREQFGKLAAKLEALAFVFALTNAQWNQLEAVIPAWCAAVRGLQTDDDVNAFIAANITPQIQARAAEARVALANPARIGSALRAYALRRITHHVEEKCGKPLRLEALFVRGVTEEHVLPQNPTQEAATAFSNVPAEVEANQYRLGNLALLLHGPNSQARNRPFVEKKEVYERCDYELTKSLVLDISTGANAAPTRVAAQFHLQPHATWNPDEVQLREGRLLEIAADIWGI